MKIKCQNCGYEWNTSSSMEMVTCPSCGYKTPKTGDVLSRLERRNRSQLQSRRGPKEVNILSTKWAGAIALLIAVAIGAWGALVYLGGEAPSSGTGEEAAPGAATVRFKSSNAVFAGGIPDNTGIENIYIVDNSESTFDVDFGGASQPGTVENTITASGSPAVNIPYDDNFFIVVAVKGSLEGENRMAYLSTENMYVTHEWTSGALSGMENSQDTGENYIFDNDLGMDTWIRVNHVFTNSGNGWRLKADETADLRENYYVYG